MAAFRSCQVLGCDLRGQAEVNANYVCAPAGCHFRESPHAATNIEHQFSRQFLGAKSSTLPKCILRSVAGGVIQLGPRVELPLKSKTAGVILRIHEADYPVQRRVPPSASRA